MSMWTYVTGYVKVDAPFVTRSADSFKSFMDWVVADLEKKNACITGSERNAITASIPSPSNSWSSETGDGFCDGTFFITGSLRDRQIAQTDKEVDKFLEKLVDYVDVGEYSIRVTDGFSGEVTNHDRFDDEKVSAKDRKARFTTQMTNVHRYYDEVVLTRDKCIEIAELFRNLGTDTLIKLMNSFGINRYYKIGIVPEHKKWLKSKNLLKSTTDEEVYDWEYEKLYGKPRKKQAGNKDTGRPNEKH